MKLDFLILIIYFRFIYNKEKDLSEGVYQIDSLFGFTLCVIIFGILAFKRKFLENYFFRLIILILINII